MDIQFETKEDYTLSPFTGWTRERWIELAEKMILGIQPYLTPGKGGLKLPNPVRWMDAFLPDPKNMESFYWMEGFTRSRLLLACWMMGTGKTNIKNGNTRIDILDQFIEGLLSASDPEHPEFIGDRYGNNQWIAETSAVALAVYIARDLVWPRLNLKNREQVVKWFQKSIGNQIPHNNWYLFVANTNLVLKSLGEHYRQDELLNCLKQIQSFYLGNGWFMDGDNKRGFSIDMYNPWGFLYFLPVFIKMGLDDSRMTEWIIDSLKKFLTSFYHFFAANGAIPMWGRSWIYRPALTTPFLWAELLGISPLKAGESRRLVSGQMKFYLENSYFNQDMTPTMGYLGENLDLIDPYSQYGSAYWASSVFMGLLCSEFHPFWTEIEKPLLVERVGYCKQEASIGILINANHHTGEVQIINHRMWHQKEGPGTRYAKKYTNFAYSSHFGIDLQRDKRGYSCDNMISVSPDGKKYSQRIIPYYIKLNENYGASFHYPLAGFPFVDQEDPTAFSGDSRSKVEEDHSVKITSQVLLKNSLQIRVHIIETSRKLAMVREGGFAVNFAGNRPQIIKNSTSIAIHDGHKGSFIKALWGFSSALPIHSNGSNTMGGKSVIPAIESGPIDNGTHIYASLSGTWFIPVDEINELLKIVYSVNLNAKRFIVYFSDNTEYSFKI